MREGPRKLGGKVERTEMEGRDKGERWRGKGGV
jgi:hypothetical protein